MDQNEDWVKVADDIDEIDFKENNIACVTTKGKSICIIKTINGLKACSAKCPHAGGDLCEAFLDKKENIVCPLHGYRFSLDTGRDITAEGYFLKIYKAEEMPDGIFIKLA